MSQMTNIGTWCSCDIIVKKTALISQKDNLVLFYLAPKNKMADMGIIWASEGEHNSRKEWCIIKHSTTVMNCKSTSSRKRTP